MGLAVAQFSRIWGSLVGRRRCVVAWRAHALHKLAQNQPRNHPPRHYLAISPGAGYLAAKTRVFAGSLCPQGTPATTMSAEADVGFL